MIHETESPSDLPGTGRLRPCWQNGRKRRFPCWVVPEAATWGMALRALYFGRLCWVGSGLLRRARPGVAIRYVVCVAMTATGISTFTLKSDPMGSPSLASLAPQEGRGPPAYPSRGLRRAGAATPRLPASNPFVTLALAVRPKREEAPGHDGTGAPAPIVVRLRSPIVFGHATVKVMEVLQRLLGRRIPGDVSRCVPVPTGEEAFDSLRLVELLAAE